MIANSTKKRYNKCRVKNAECRVEMIFCRDRRPRRPAKNERFSLTKAGVLLPFVRSSTKKIKNTFLKGKKKTF